MARRHSKSGKKRTHKVRRHRGGGWGFTGPSSIPGTPGIVNNPQVFTGIGDCRAVQPGYNIPYSQYSASLKGLPGMSGGSKVATDQRGGKRTRKQRGGRYGFFPESIGTVTPNGAAWWAGTYPPVQRIACEGTTQNPLNPTHTGSSEPAGAANPNYYLKGGKRSRKHRQRGGQQLAPATYGVGNVDSMYYYAPTAGYANTASTWKDSVGAPVQIQVPFAARAMNQACLSTGGHPPLTGALQKGGSQVTTDQRGGKRRKTRKGGAYYGLPTSMNNLRSLGSQLTGLFGLGAPAVAATPEIAEVETVEVTEPVAETMPAPMNAPTSMNTPANAPAPNMGAPAMNMSGNTSSQMNMTNRNAQPNNLGLGSNTNEPVLVMGGRAKKHRKHKKGTKKARKGRGRS